jgi:hypothetical protein
MGLDRGAVSDLRPRGARARHRQGRRARRHSLQGRASLGGADGRDAESRRPRRLHAPRPSRGPTPSRGSCRSITSVRTAAAIRAGCWPTRSTPAASILRVADVYAALTEPRPYHTPADTNTAIAAMSALSGSKIDATAFAAPARGRRACRRQRHLRVRKHARGSRRSARMRRVQAALVARRVGVAALPATLCGRAGQSRGARQAPSRGLQDRRSLRQQPPPARGAMSGMADMMQGMGTTPPKELYPRLIGLPALTPEQLAELQRDAHARMESGTRACRTRSRRSRKPRPETTTPRCRTRWDECGRASPGSTAVSRPTAAAAEGARPSRSRLEWFRKN